MPRGCPRITSIGRKVIYRKDKLVNMAKFKCEKCGWVGKPIFMEPATRLCPNCRGVNLKKVKSEKE